MLDVDVHISLFLHLSAHALLRSLVEFEDSTWRFPVAVVTTPNDEDSVLVVDDYAGDAN